MRGLVYASSLHDQHSLTALQLYQIISIRSLHYQIISIRSLLYQIISIRSLYYQIISIRSLHGQIISIRSLHGQIISIRSLHYQGRFFMQVGGALTPYRWITHKLPQLVVTRCASGIPIISPIGDY